MWRSLNLRPGLKTHWRTAAIAASLFALAAPLQAATVYDIDLDPTGTLYGTVDQDDVLVGPGNSGVNSCAPTATMNSFTYLQNAFPTVYGTDDELMGVSNTWLEAAIDLASNYMNTSSETGTSDENWIMGKVEYLETYAPGKTTYAGMNEFTTGGQDWVTLGIPTIGFLIDQLLKGANIELGISPGAQGIGHVLTLSSLHWVDENSDGIFDNDTEDATLDGIDPATGSAFELSLKTITIGDNTYLGFDGGGYDGYRIDAALAEVAVPEPATWVLLSVGAIALVAARRRNRRD
jgi:hypothetical protein